MPVSRYIDARVLSIFEGAEETLAWKVIARLLVDNAKAKAEVEGLSHEFLDATE